MLLNVITRIILWRLTSHDFSWIHYHIAWGFCREMTWLQGRNIIFGRKSSCLQSCGIRIASMFELFRKTNYFEIIRPFREPGPLDHSDDTGGHTLIPKRRFGGTSFRARIVFPFDFLRLSLWNGKSILLAWKETDWFAGNPINIPCLLRRRKITLAGD
jgi:hypothetical protein